VSDSDLLAHDRARGVRLIAGVDEVGRACLAGPIMAAGVLFDLERLASGAGRALLEELDDSKRLGRAKRERLAQAVLAQADAVSLVSVPASQIDRMGIDGANVACLERALRGLGERAELRLVDGRLALGAAAPVHELIVHGDATSATVAAASIVAKVARDRLMAHLGERYPGYGFERNKGYWSEEHVLAVAELGPSPEHRLSFNGCCAVEAAVAAPARGRKSRRASWRELPPAEMAAHLLETPTIGDRVWTDEPRLPRESRTAFIRRVLLDEKEPVEDSKGESAATETISSIRARPEHG
jgi:ribonuclease HII